MKNNKSLILFILLLQGICYSCFAQRCNQSQQNRVENQGDNVILPKVADKDISSEVPIHPNEIIGFDGYDAVVLSNSSTLK